MSRGPVGLSDALGMSNATLLQRTITRDGTLLKPAKPVTAVDSTFRSQGAPTGQVYASYDSFPSHGDGGGVVFRFLLYEGPLQPAAR